MATHSNVLVWKIPRTEEPGRLQSKGHKSVGYDWARTHMIEDLFWAFQPCSLYSPLNRQASLLFQEGAETTMQNFCQKRFCSQENQSAQYLSTLCSFQLSPLGTLWGRRSRIRFTHQLSIVSIHTSLSTLVMKLKEWQKHIFCEKGKMKVAMCFIISLVMMWHLYFGLLKSLSHTYFHLQSCDPMRSS